MTSSPTDGTRPSVGVVLPGANKLGGGAATRAPRAPRGMRAHVTAWGGRPGCRPRAGGGGVEAQRGAERRLDLLWRPPGGSAPRRGFRVPQLPVAFGPGKWGKAAPRSPGDPGRPQNCALGPLVWVLTGCIVWGVPSPRQPHTRTFYQCACAEVGTQFPGCAASGPTRRKTVWKPERALL